MTLHEKRGKRKEEEGWIAEGKPGGNLPFSTFCNLVARETKGCREQIVGEFPT